MCMHQQRTYLNYIPYKEMKIPKEIRKRVEKLKPSGGGQTHWLCWFQEYEDDLLARIFAAKKTKSRGTELFEVMRENIGGTFYLQRNLYYNGMAGWECWFPAENEIIPNDWQTVPVDKMPGVWIEMINPDAIFTVEKFKYCGYRGGFPLAPYLRMYLEEPGVEFFAKMQLRPTKALVKKAKADPNFRKWLRKLSADEIHAANIYGPQAVLKAYKLKTTDFAKVSGEISDAIRRAREVTSCGANAAMKKGKWKAEKIIEYIRSEASFNFAAYGDYIRACDYLRLDLKDTKVAFPRQFRRMHDLRIQEMQSRKAAEDAEKKRELWARFQKVAEGLKPFEFAADGFAIIIPTDAADLVKEGLALQHCVGRMGYDVKEANGASFIAFLRKAEEIEKPFVTVEFGIRTKKLLQCYGAKDSKPAEDVLQFVNRWAEDVKNALLEQEAAEKEAQRQQELETLKERLKNKAAAAATA